MSDHGRPSGKVRRGGDIVHERKPKLDRELYEAELARLRREYDIAG